MDQKKALMERIRLFVLDLDGTVYLGDRLLPGAADFITTAKEKGRRVLFFTNNTSRSPMEYVERLTRMGIPVTRGDILTAGDVTVHHLKTCRPGKSVCLLGVPALRQSFLEAGIPLTEVDLQHDLDRRRPGTSRYTTQRREPDQVKILSGVFEGVTTGTSIGLLIENTDQRSQDYGASKDLFRPGHADYTYEQKYGLRDYRGGGRSSARETAMRVAAGAIAKKYLAAKFGIVIRGCLTQMGDIPLAIKDWDQVEQNPFFCPAPDKIAALETAKSDSEEQRKANLKALEEAREESADLKQKLIAIRDENIGYRKRITELNTKLINADVELSKLEANPEKSPLLLEENQLLRSTIAKQLRILSVQDQSRSLLISTYKRLLQENADTSEIASLMDNEEAIKLTPAEKQIVNVIARDNKIDPPDGPAEGKDQQAGPGPFRGTRQGRPACQGTGTGAQPDEDKSGQIRQE